GSDVFAALEAELAGGSPEDHWVGYFGYACRPDLPAAVGDPLPDAVWMRPREIRFFEHEVPAGNSRLPHEPSYRKQEFHRVPGEPPAAYATAFAEVQEQLHAGNSYEVNLTYRVEAPSDTDPVTAYLRLRELNPAPYAGFLQHDVPDAR